MRLRYLVIAMLPLSASLAAESAGSADTITVTGEQASVHANAASTGTLTNADPVDLPQSIEVIPQSVLEQRYTTTFYDSLAYESGVFTGGRSSFSISAGQPSMRGFGYNDVMLNGLVLPTFMPILMDAGGIASIEFYKGPLNGTLGGQGGQQGSGGGVNILSKIAELDQTFNRVVVGGTAGNGTSQRLTYDPNIRLSDTLAVRCPLVVERSRPFYLPGDIQDDRTVMAAPSLRWQATPTTMVTIASTLQYTNKAAYQGIPYLKGEFLVPIDTYYGDDTTRDQYHGMTLQGRVEQELTDHLSLDAGAGIARLREQREHWSVYPFAGFGPGAMSVEDYYNYLIANRSGRFDYTTIDEVDQNRNLYAYLKHDRTFGSVRNQLTGGVDWLERQERSGDTFFMLATGTTNPSTWMDIDDPTLVVPSGTPSAPTESKVRRWGTVLQDYATWGRWRFLAGARLDHHVSESGNDANSFSPHAGITCWVLPKVALYTNYTLAAGPNFGSTDIDGNELTNSWRSEQVEAGTKLCLGDNLWTTLDVFQIRQKDVPETDPADPSGRASIAVGENRSRGIEASLSGELTADWKWWGSYSYLQYRDVYNGIDFLRFPRNSASIWTSYRIPSGPLKDLTPSAGVRYVGKYLTTFRDEYISDDFVIEGHTTLDLACAYPLRFIDKRGDTNLQVGVKNVFNTEYVESNRFGTENFPGLPRTVWMQLDTTF